MLTPKYSGGTCTAALDTVPAVKPSPTLASAARVTLRASTGRSSVINTAALPVLSLLSSGLPLLVVMPRPAAARLHLSSTAVLPARMDCCAATSPQLPSRLLLAMAVSSAAADPDRGCALFSPLSPPCERRPLGPLQVANDSCTLRAALLDAVLHGWYWSLLMLVERQITSAWSSGTGQSMLGAILRGGGSSIPVRWVCSFFGMLKMCATCQQLTAPRPTHRVVPVRLSTMPITMPSGKR